MDVFVNAEQGSAGRTASRVAKELLKGNRVVVVNAEKAVISGDHSYTIDQFKHRIERGDPYHGPFQPKQPDRILKRMVRGMLPYKKPLGKKALKQLRVYTSVPEEYKKEKFTDVKAQKGITLKQLSERL